MCSPTSSNLSYLHQIALLRRDTTRWANEISMPPSLQISVPVFQLEEENLSSIENFLSRYTPCMLNMYPILSTAHSICAWYFNKPVLLFCSAILGRGIIKKEKIDLKYSKDRLSECSAIEKEISELELKKDQMSEKEQGRLAKVKGIIDQGKEIIHIKNMNSTYSKISIQALSHLNVISSLALMINSSLPEDYSIASHKALSLSLLLGVMQVASYLGKPRYLNSCNLQEKERQLSILIEQAAS